MFCARHGRHDLRVQEKVGVEDANHLELTDRVLCTREPVEHDPLADDVRIGVEGAFPERVAEDDDWRFARQVIVGREESAVTGLRAEQVKKAR